MEILVNTEKRNRSSYVNTTSVQKGTQENYTVDFQTGNSSDHMLLVMLRNSEQMTAMITVAVMLRNSKNMTVVVP